MKTSESKPNYKFEDVSQQPQRQKKLWLTLSVTLLLAGGTCLLWYLLTPKNPSSSQVATEVSRPRPVETATLNKGDGTRRVILIGQVEASKIATIRAQTTGWVEEVLVREGDRVTKGMTIAILENTDQQLALSQAKARLATERSKLARLEIGTRQEIIQQRRAALSAAKAREKEALDNLERISSLVTEGALSQRSLVEARATVDTAKGERLEAAAALAEAIAGSLPEDIAAQKAVVEAAQAAVKQAKLEFDRTRIQALSDGVVQSRLATRGDYLEVADPVLTLVDSRQLDIFLELPEKLSGQIRPGKTVILSSRNLPNWRDSATITGVIPSTEEGSRRQLVRISIDNPPQELISGMAVRGELQIPLAHDSFIISRDALVRRGNKWLVFTVTNGQAQQIEVKLVADMGSAVAIASEQLQIGQQLVVQGGDALSDGAAVKARQRYFEQDN